MNIWEKLKAYFNGRQFKRVDLHREGMNLYYISESGSVSMVWMIDEEAIRGLGPEKVKQYGETIRGNFLKQGFEFVQLHILFITSDVEWAKSLGEGMMYWIVDEAYGRLVIFENQPEEFLGLRGMIETNLSFGGNSRNSDGYQTSAMNQQPQQADFISRQEQREKERILRKQRAERSQTVWSKMGSVSCVTFGLIIVNLLIFFGIDIFGNGWDAWNVGGISWASVIGDGEFYRLFTCLFLHGSIDHVGGNMLALYAAGDIVERVTGHWRFALLYVIAGFGSSFASIIYHHYTDAFSISIGASGAIYGIFGALVMMFLVDPALRTGNNIGRMGVLVVYLFYSIFLHPEANVDYAGHIGGFVVGSIAYAVMYWIRGIRQKRRQKNSPWGR